MGEPEALIEQPGRLATGAEDLCAISTDVTELIDPAKDGFALSQEWGKQVWLLQPDAEVQNLFVVDAPALTGRP